MKFAIALSLLTLAFALTGCAGVAESMIDPQGYTQRSQSQSEALRSQAQAQQAFAESQKALADSEAERSRSEARRAEAEAQTAQAQAAADQANADADARAAEAQANFATAATKAVKDAAAQNKGVLIFAIALIAGMAAWMIHNNTKVVMAVAQQQTRPAAAMLPQSAQGYIIAAPPSVQMIADAKGLRPQFDGERWLLVDREGVVRERQRLITG